MKSTWKHRWKRLVHRRGVLPRTVRLQRLTHAPLPRRRAFARPRFGRFDLNFRWRRLLGRVGLGMFAVFALWFLWQSWLGLGVFNH